jgi:signal transduction histidine kinase
MRSRPLRGKNPSAGERMRRWPLQRVFVVGAIVTAVLALAAILLGIVALYRLSDVRSALLNEVVPAQQAAQDLSLALLNQETGVRGYDLSGRQEFLDPYRAGVVAEQEAAATLRRLALSPELAVIDADVDAVGRAAASWRAGYAELAIAAGARTPGVVSADPVVGRALFDEVRAAVATLSADLSAEQAAARARMNEAATFVVTVGIAIAAVMAAFLIAVGIGLRRGVLRPIAQLAGQVRQVVNGDVQREVHATGPREIVGLGEDIESMRAHILNELEVVRQVNQRLDEQARDLERSNRDLEQFAYVASHDLQEPLRKVSSFCQLLQRRYGGQLDERADQYIGFAVDGAQRMQRLINDLLAFSRVGRTTEGFEPVDLDAVAAAVVAQLEAARADTGGVIVVDELPTVQGDPALLRQLLLNLVGNGLKFRREGVAPEVRVHARAADDNGWEITVADNGIGIEQEYTDKVFVIFQRLHGRERYEGTGIGLALAKKIVEFHGGRIWIDTQRSEGGASIGSARAEPGTTVRFTLPAPSRNGTDEPEESA